MITKIWLYNGWRNIAPSDPITSTRRLQSFCITNNLPSPIVKSQGGYYMITSEGTLKFIDRSLGNLTFEDIYELLNSKK